MQEYGQRCINMDYNANSHINSIKEYYRFMLFKVVKIVMGTQC